MFVMPYLNFRGQAREVLSFYQAALGGDVEIMPFSSMAGMEIDPAEAEWAMHGQLTLTTGQAIAASDIPSSMEWTAPAGHSVAIIGDAAELDALREQFDTLSAGGTIGVPLSQAPWGDWYGQFTDKFGINWMFDVPAA